MHVRYLRWMEEHLGPRPDPLRLVVQSGQGAWLAARARFQRHQESQAQTDLITPKTRAQIDDEPGKKRASA